MKADWGTTKDKDQEERSGSAAQEQREEANKEAPLVWGDQGIPREKELNKNGKEPTSRTVFSIGIADLGVAVDTFR